MSEHQPEKTGAFTPLSDADLEAGLAAAFGGPASVLHALRQSLAEVPRVQLPEPDSGATSPVVLPAAAEVPAAEAAGEPGSDAVPSRYQLQGEIARGGMGSVLKGRDADLGRDVTVKVLLDRHAGQLDLVCRFVEEAQIAGQLQHPGIVPVYELGQLQGRPFYAMKLVKGHTLARLLETRGDPGQDLPRFVQVFEQVCQALAYAHTRGVIHRDLKPSNVMVGGFGEVLVMDWGLAKVLRRLGWLLAHGKRWAEAEGFYRVALGLRPDSPGVWLNLGLALADQGKLDEAVACYHRAIELDPKFAWAHNNLGIALEKQGKLDEAVVCYRRAIQLDPKDAQAHNNLGNALAQQGKPDQAVACFRRTLQLNPKIPEAHCNPSHTGLVGTPIRQQSWAPDQLGNFGTVTTSDNGVVTQTQNRTHNQQNQINRINNGGPNLPLNYDNEGNLVQDSSGPLNIGYVYDAWNRLLSRTTTGPTPDVSYQYDGLERRIQETRGSLVTDLYYSNQGQVLEEDQTQQSNGPLRSRQQYVWSPVYVNALVERDAMNAQSGATQRLYAAQDANWNVTALVDISGSTQPVVERYVYDPYGAVTILAPDGSTRTVSSVSWVYLFQGGRLDVTTNLYRFGERDYSPVLMRWTQQDPLGYGGGDTNLYRDVGNGPTNATDPLGLQPYPGFPHPPKVPMGWEQFGPATRVAKKVEETGPDVTNWFLEEIRIYQSAVKQAKKDWVDQAHVAAWAGVTFPLNPRGIQMRAAMNYYGNRKADDKNRPELTRYNTVTLAGQSIGLNQPGNIMFGIVAQELDLVDDARAYGRGEFLAYQRAYLAARRGSGPFPWTKAGQGNREAAFEIGVQLGQFVRCKIPCCTGWQYPQKVIGGVCRLSHTLMARRGDRYEQICLFIWPRPDASRCQITPGQLVDRVTDCHVCCWLGDSKCGDRISSTSAHSLLFQARFKIVGGGRGCASREVGNSGRTDNCGNKRYKYIRRCVIFIFDHDLDMTEGLLYCPNGSRAFVRKLTRASELLVLRVRSFLSRRTSWKSGMRRQRTPRTMVRSSRSQAKVAHQGAFSLLPPGALRPALHKNVAGCLS